MNRTGPAGHDQRQAQRDDARCQPGTATQHQRQQPLQPRMFRKLIHAAPPSMWISRALRNICIRSEEHTSELQSLMRISYAVFCLKKKKKNKRRIKSRKLQQPKLKTT